MKVKPVKYLDQILKILANNFGKELSIQEIQNELTPIKIFGTTGNVTFSLDLLTDSQHALAYLKKLDLVFINPTDGKIMLTYEGYIKIKTSSFSKEIKDKYTNQLLQRLSWIVPIIISLFALWVSFNKDHKNPLENLNQKKSCVTKSSLKDY